MEPAAAVNAVWAAGLGISRRRRPGARCGDGARLCAATRWEAQVNLETDFEDKYLLLDFLLKGTVKDSLINLDQNLLKVVKIFGQVESTVQVKITEK